MKADEITERIEASPLKPEIEEIVELELVRPSKIILDDYRIEPPEARPFAMDGSGGFFSVTPDGRILLIDSEGLYGIVAPDFDTFIAIATGLPIWRDALRFVGEADIARARADWEAFLQKNGFEADLDAPWPYGSAGLSIATPGAARREIRAQLGIAASEDPFAALYHAVNGLSQDVSVFWQGEPLLLFGRIPTVRH
ncbi:hypothetical protein [Afifella sp. YEN Y35]|uniref:hypothetical protein n=1 Tax=Afifella sp. YEN Y35 TaxID=3388337 RepID=UPI0039DF7775